MRRLSVGPSRRRLAVLLVGATLLAPVMPAAAQVGPQAQPQSQAPVVVFRAGRELVSVDVVVRDRSGALVRDLTPADFEVREDGRPQEILTASFQQIDASAARLGPTPLLGASAAARGASASSPGATSTDLSGRRLVLLLFDVGSMELEDLDRGVDSALRWVDTRMTGADLVAVASLTWRVDLLTDFTGDPATVRAALQRLVGVDAGSLLALAPGPDAAAAGAADPATDGAAADGTAAALATADARLRALRVIAEALAPINQKKALLYFTSGLGDGAQDSQVELRAATTAAARAHVAVYPVDTRGLRVVVPNGPARVASRSGEGLFSGRDVADQFDDLTASQDTLVSIASATGGRTFSDTNDLGDAFTRVERDTAAYYLLGFSSANAAQDGRFRRLQVRVRRQGVTVEARAGYFAERDFAHTSREDRDLQLAEALASAPVGGELPLTAVAGWLAAADGRAWVPLALSIPRAAFAPAGRTRLDVAAEVRDEQDQVVARVTDQVGLPAAASGVTSTAAGANADLVYRSGATLPPGRYRLRAVVRERDEGRLGVAERDLVIPERMPGMLTLGSVLVDGASAAAGAGALPAGLVREAGDRAWLVPDGAVTAGSNLRLVVEAYAREWTPQTPPRLRAVVTAYRDGVPVFESPAVSHTRLDDPALGAARLLLDVSTAALPPGRYTWQVTVVDEGNAGAVGNERFAIARTVVDVRPAGAGEPGPTR